MSEQTAFEKRLGQYKIYGVIENEVCTFFGECGFEPAASIVFQTKAAPARVYFNESQRPCIQDLFPDMPKELRQLLSDGTSPAAYDEMLGKKMPKTLPAFMRKYKKFGYRFD